MTVLPISRMGSEILRKRAEDVTDLRGCRPPRP